MLTKIGEQHLSYYRKEARIKNFFGENKMERVRLERIVFGQVEKAMRDVFMATDNGTVLDKSDFIKTLLRFIAIHLIRSKSSDKRWGELWQDYQRKSPVLRSVPDNDPSVIKIRTEALINVLDKIFNDLMSGAWIEIGVAAKGTSFVLADTGAFIMDSDTGRMGLHNDVSFQMANGLMLPLGPRYVAAVCTGQAPPPQYRQLSESSVQRFNNFQQNVAVKKVYFQPEE